MFKALLKRLAGGGKRTECGNDIGNDNVTADVTAPLPAIVPPEEESVIPAEPEVVREPSQVYEIGADYPCLADPDIPEFLELNPLQSCFKDKYNPNKHAVIVAGTNTGKSACIWIAQMLRLRRGERSIVLAPTQELVKSEYKEMIGLHGGGIVGLSTGNNKDVNGKYIIVATPESYISALRKNLEWAEASLLVVDESHNLFDENRGGDIDVAITLFIRRGGKVMLMSGTFPHHKELAQKLDADLFICNYKRTIIHTKHGIEDDCPYDFGAIKKSSAKDKDLAKPGMVITKTGDFVYNEKSVRLARLKGVLKLHTGESILIFVPTKAIGFALADHLKAGFHCADVEQEARDELIASFSAGTRKILIATSTLSQGVNTPADIVVIFGTRSFNNYSNSMDIDQKKGRAGRGRDEATVYLIMDKIEYYHAIKEMLITSLPLPVESMTLTLLSLDPASKRDLTDVLGSTYAAALSTPEKVAETVGRYLHYLESCHLLKSKEGKFSLTQEGTLLARFYIKPSEYLGYIKMARKLMEIPEPLPKGQVACEPEPEGHVETVTVSSTAEDDRPVPAISALSKGLILLSLVLPGNNYYNCPERFKKDVQMRLIEHDLDREVSIEKIGILRSYLEKPSLMPQFFPWQLPTVDRWLALFSDMDRFGVHSKTPGSDYLRRANSELKKVANAVLAKAKAKKMAKDRELANAKVEAIAKADGTKQAKAAKAVRKLKDTGQMDLVGITTFPVVAANTQDIVSQSQGNVVQFPKAQQQPEEHKKAGESAAVKPAAAKLADTIAASCEEELAMLVSLADCEELDLYPGVDEVETRAA